MRDESDATRQAALKSCGFPKPDHAAWLQVIAYLPGLRLILPSSTLSREFAAFDLLKPQRLSTDCF